MPFRTRLKIQRRWRLVYTTTHGWCLLVKEWWEQTGPPSPSGSVPLAHRQHLVPLRPFVLGAACALAIVLTVLVIALPLAAH